MIEVEVEDDAWRAVADVEALVTLTVDVTLAELSAPSPLMGEGQGWGCSAAVGQRSADVHAPSFPAGGAASPSNPPPSRGRALDLSVLLTSDTEICDLNARFRGKDQPTNVLSFPALETAHPHLGDIALAHGVCAAEAAAQGKTLADHLSHLVVHGVLHLIGYDHQADAPAEAMEAKERDILSRLGVGDPYRQERLHAGP